MPVPPWRPRMPERSFASKFLSTGIPSIATSDHDSDTPTSCIVQLVSKIPQHDFQASGSDPSQKILDMVFVARNQEAKHLQPGERALNRSAPMAGLIGRLLLRHLPPLRPGAQNPYHPVPHHARISRRSPLPLGPPLLQDRFQQNPLRVADFPASMHEFACSNRQISFSVSRFSCAASLFFPCSCKKSFLRPALVCSGSEMPIFLSTWPSIRLCMLFGVWVCR